LDSARARDTASLRLPLASPYLRGMPMEGLARFDFV
jgi:hypothetical protein